MKKNTFWEFQEAADSFVAIESNDARVEVDNVDMADVVIGDLQMAVDCQVVEGSARKCHIDRVVEDDVEQQVVDGDVI